MMQKKEVFIGWAMRLNLHGMDTEFVVVAPNAAGLRKVWKRLQITSQKSMNIKKTGKVIVVLAKHL